ncbi:hypothetical protein [Clostridium sp. DJ247]|uniref:hypothetical protein n=1 Tax=Clostridium sp. DJ247 TaxID=2726188 RepID=UPI00162A70E5|nr:hypothetical protein [Clostridium sp. DJ247]MBC2579968.1 hypothetical protein [Clostridium sp. DJ247]
MEKLYNTLRELETRGTLQQQAKNLYSEEREYKRLIAKYKNNELLKQKYEIRLEHVKTEMMYLNTKIIDTLNIIEEFVDVEVFCELFGVDYENYDEDENFYNNLLVSNNNYIAHVCRQGLIHNEKIVKEFMEL